MECSDFESAPNDRTKDAFFARSAARAHVFAVERKHVERVERGFAAAAPSTHLLERSEEGDQILPLPFGEDEVQVPLVVANHTIKRCRDSVMEVRRACGQCS